LYFFDSFNGLRQWRVGGRGFCLGAGETRSQKNACLHRAADTGEMRQNPTRSLHAFFSPCLALEEIEFLAYFILLLRFAN
jgi:hypothetical protein